MRNLSNLLSPVLPSSRVHFGYAFLTSSLSLSLSLSLYLCVCSSLFWIQSPESANQSAITVQARLVIAGVRQVSRFARSASEVVSVHKLGEVSIYSPLARVAPPYGCYMRRIHSPPTHALRQTPQRCTNHSYVCICCVGDIIRCVTCLFRYFHLYLLLYLTPG